MYQLIILLFSLAFPLFSFSQQWVNDQNFYTANGGNSASGINHLFIDHQDRILITGSFTTYNDTIVNKLTRIKPNGGIDTSFHTGSGFDNFVYAFREQSDNKIIIAGEFGFYNGTTVNRIVRINENGSLDNSFNTGSGANGTIWSINIQTDGKMILTGSFTEFNGIPANGIIRLNSDGSIDSSLNVGTGPNSGTLMASLQPDGKIIVVGQFTTFNGVSAKCIVRLDALGNIDNSFSANNNTYASLSKALVKANGEIIVFGNFNEFDNVPMNKIACLNSTGQLNTQFSTGVFNNVQMLRSVLQNDGKLILFGSFTSYDNVAHNYLIRLNPDGTPDSTFDMGVGADDWVQAVEIQSTGRVVIAGKFNNFMGELKNDMTRISYCSTTTSTTIQSACGSYHWSQNNQTYTTSGVYHDTIPNAAGCDSIITLDLTIIPELPLTITNSFSMPSDASFCVGEAAITVSGNADFELNVDNGSQVVTSSGYSLITNLCAGVHDLHVTDHCGDTLTTQFVIPVDSNYVFNNPFIDSLAADSLGVTVTNCDIYYAGIDTAYIDSIWANGNTVNVIWNIVDSNGSNFDTTSYVLNNGNGVYWLQLSVFCPNKSIGEYFAVTEAIYFNNGLVSTAGISDYKQALFEVYPNPTNNQVTINFSGSDVELTVYDLQGKVVLKDNIQNQETISLENFERGVYLFNFKNSQGQSVQRVVKQ